MFVFVVCFCLKNKGNKGKSSTSRGLPSGGKPAKKLAQGCPPLEGAIEGQVSDGGMLRGGRETCI